MGLAHSQGIESTAAVLHHPLHPLSVTLPIGTLVFALAADIVFLLTKDLFWTEAAFWLLWAGIVTGFIAAGLGMIDYLAITEVRKLRVAQLHGLGNIAAVVTAIANLVVHWIVKVPTLGWLAVVLSVATVGTLAITGYLGGKLSYKYRIGQIAPAHGGQIPEPITTSLLTHPSRNSAS